MSPQARRERAYNHYVQKRIKERQRQMARAQKAANRQMKKRLKYTEPSDPRITTSLGPEPGVWSEPTADAIAAPVTVSPSDPGAMPAAYQPSQP